MLATYSKYQSDIEIQQFRNRILQTRYCFIPYYFFEFLISILVTLLLAGSGKCTHTDYKMCCSNFHVTLILSDFWLAFFEKNFLYFFQYFLRSSFYQNLYYWFPCTFMRSLFIVEVAISALQNRFHSINSDKSSLQSCESGL